MDTFPSKWLDWTPDDDPVERCEFCGEPLGDQVWHLSIPHSDDDKPNEYIMTTGAINCMIALVACTYVRQGKEAIEVHDVFQDAIQKGILAALNAPPKGWNL